MFKIGEFSKLSNITVKMLRHYDEIGLLKPTKVDDHTNYRYYSANELEIASKITTYKNLGFSLNMIITLLESESEEEELINHYKLRIAEIKEEQEKLERQMEMLKKVSEINKNLNMIKYNVVEKEIPKRKVVSLRRKIPNYYDEGMLWSEMQEFLFENNIEPVYDGYTMAVYHDDEYKEENVDVEIQMTVEELRENLGNFKFFETKSQPIVSVTFSGTYEQISKVVEAIAFYVEQNNLIISSSMANIFHVSPAQTENEDEYITESCYFIEK